MHRILGNMQCFLGVFDRWEFLMATDSANCEIVYEIAGLHTVCVKQAAQVASLGTGWLNTAVINLNHLYDIENKITLV